MRIPVDVNGQRPRRRTQKARNAPPIGPLVRTRLSGLLRSHLDVLISYSNHMVANPKSSRSLGLLAEAPKSATRHMRRFPRCHCPLGIWPNAEQCHHLERWVGAWSIPPAWCLRSKNNGWSTVDVKQW